MNSLAITLPRYVEREATLARLERELDEAERELEAAPSGSGLWDWLWRDIVKISREIRAIKGTRI